jgi:hypothetical protein
MAMKIYFFLYDLLITKDGLEEVRFTKDKWLGTTTFREQYPSLYKIVRHKGDTITKIFKYSPPNVTFIRHFVGHRSASWNALL